MTSFPPAGSQSLFHQVIFPTWSFLSHLHHPPWLRLPPLPAPELCHRDYFAVYRYVLGMLRLVPVLRRHRGPAAHEICVCHLLFILSFQCSPDGLPWDFYLNHPGSFHRKNAETTRDLVPPDIPKIIFYS